MLGLLQKLGRYQSDHVKNQAGVEGKINPGIPTNNEGVAHQQSEGEMLARKADAPGNISQKENPTIARGKVTFSRLDQFVRARAYHYRTISSTSEDYNNEFLITMFDNVDELDFTRFSFVPNGLVDTKKWVIIPLEYLPDYLLNYPFEECDNTTWELLQEIYKLRSLKYEKRQKYLLYKQIHAPSVFEDISSWFVIDDKSDTVPENQRLTLQRNSKCKVQSVDDIFEWSLTYRMWAIARGASYIYTKVRNFLNVIGRFLLVVNFLLNFLSLPVPQWITTFGQFIYKMNYNHFRWWCTHWIFHFFIRRGLEAADADNSPDLRVRFENRRKRLGVFAHMSDRELRELGLIDVLIAEGNEAQIKAYAHSKRLMYLEDFQDDIFHLMEVKVVLEEFHRREQVARDLELAQNPPIVEDECPLFTPESKYAKVNARKVEKAFKHKDKAVTRHIDDDGTPTPSGLVFEGEPLYKGEILSETMCLICWEHIPEFLANLCTLVNDKEGFSGLLRKEIYRSFHSVRYCWKFGSKGREMLKDFLSGMNDDVFYDSVNCSYVRPEWLPPLESTPELRFPILPQNYFCGKWTKNGWQDPQLEMKVVPNAFEEHFSKIVVKSKFLTLQKLRCCMQTMRVNFNRREVVQKIKAMLYAPDDHEIICNDISWIFPWIPTEYFYAHVTEERQGLLFTILRDKIFEFRKQVIDYCFRYLEIGEMEEWERRELYWNRSRIFARYMRRPEVQNQFVIGKSRAEVVELLYRRNIKKFNDIVDYDPQTVAIKKRSKKDKSNSIKEARRLKYQPESFSSVITTVACNGGVLALLAALFYYIKKNEIDELLRRGRTLTNFAGNTLVSATRTIEKTEKVIDQAVGFVDEVGKLFENNSVLDRFGNLAADIKKVVQVIYYGVQGEYMLMLDAVSDLILRHPSKFQNLTLDCFVHCENLAGGIFDKFRPKANFTPEAHGLEDLIVSPFVQLVHSFGGSKLTTLEMRDANTRMQYMAMSAKFWNDSATMCKGIIGFIGRELFSYDPFDPEYQAFVEKTMSFIEAADGFLLQEPKLPVDMNLCRSILLEREHGVLIKNDDMFSRLNSSMQKLHAHRFALVERLAIRAGPILKGSGTRAEPVGILFTGPPGVGKSQAIAFLCQGLSTLEGEEFQEQDVFYGGVQKYYDGYSNQMHFVMDDAFAKIAQEERSAEAHFIIKGVNSIPYSLEMAQCENKGQVYFTSPYLYLSTNLCNNGFKSTVFEVGMSDPDAVKRRIHIVLHRSKRFSEEEPDLKIECLKFEVSKCDGFPDIVGKELTLFEISKKIFQLREQHKQWHMARHRPNQYFKELYRPESVYSEMKSTIKRYTDKVVVSDQETFDYAFNAFVATVCAITIGSAAMAISNFFSVPDIQLESDERLQRRYVKHRRRPNQAPRKDLEEAVEASRFIFKPQSTQNYESCLCNTIHKGLLTILCYNDIGEEVDYFGGFHIKDGVCMTVAHGMIPSLMKDIAVIKVRWNTSLQVISPKDIRMCRFKERDFVMFCLPDLGNLPVSLYKYIITEEHDVEIPIGAPVTVLHLDREANRSFRRATKATECEDRLAEYEVHGETFLVESQVTYFADTQAGDSGAPISAMAKEGRVAIVGMHLASAPCGNLRTGAAIRFNQTIMDVWMSKFYSFYTPESKRFELPIQTYAIADPATFPPRKHALKKGFLFEAFGPAEKAPASLSMEAYKKAVSTISQECNDGKYHLSHEAKSYILSCYPPQRCQVRTAFEVLNGYVDHLGNQVPGLRVDTHGGYGYHPKSKFVTVEDTKEGKIKTPTPEFQQQIDDLVAKVRRGEVDEKLIFYDCLKVELRTLKKVSEENSRLFSCCPFLLTIVNAMFYSDFFAYIQSQCRTQPVSVGLNVHSHDWKKLHDDLLVPGGGIDSGDFTKFDKKFPYDVGMDVAEVTNRWYKGSNEDSEARLAIMRMLMKARHVIFDHLYQAENGVPSGAYGTVMINSLGLMGMKFDVYTLDFHLREDQFVIRVYGDDNLGGHPPGVVTYSKLSECFLKRFGMVYTHWSKEAFDKQDSIRDIRYLGRKFEVHDSQMMAPLETKIVEQMGYYVEGQDDELLTHLSTTSSYMLEASHFGEDVFNEMKRKYLDAVKIRKPEYWHATRKVSYDYWYFYNGRYSSDRRTNFGWLPDESGWSRISDRKNDVLGVDSSSVVNFIPVTNKLNFIPQSMMAGGGPDFKSGDPDFATNDAAPITTSVLGAQEMIGADVGVVIPGMEFPLNHPNANLKAMVEREVIVGSFQILTTTAANTTVLSVPFPNVLFTNAALGSVIANYKGFRAGVRIRVIASAAKTNYGFYMMDWFPYHCNSTSNSSGTQNRSGRDHLLVNIEKNETVEMDCPFVSPYRYLDPNNYYSDEIGLLTFRTVSQMYNVNGTAATVNFTVLAQFVDTELILPIPLALSAKEEWENVEKGTALFIPNSKREGQRKAKDDSYSSLIKTTVESAVKVAIGSIPALANIAVLDKPSNVDISGVPKVSFWAHDFHSEGVDTAMTAGPSQDTQAATANVFGRPDETNFREVAGTPMLQYTLLFSSNTTPTQVGYLSRNGTTNFDAVLSNLFNFRSGGYKFKFYFSCSTLHVARFVFYLAPSGSTTNGSEWQRCHYKIVDVVGPTETEIFVAYPEQSYTNQTNENNWALFGQCLQYSAPLGTATPIIMATYSAASEDVQYWGYLDKTLTFTPNSCPRKDFKKKFEPLHPGMELYTTTGMNSDSFTDMRQLMKLKYFITQKANGTALTIGQPSPITYGASNTVNGLVLLIQFYLFWRGSRVLKLGTKDTNPITFMSMLSNNSDPMIYADCGSGACPVTEMKMPWNGEISMVQTRFPSTVSETSRSYVKWSTLGSGAVWLGGGDDFTVSHLMYPPWAVTFANATTVGTPGAAAYYV